MMHIFACLSVTWLVWTLVLMPIGLKNMIGPELALAPVMWGLWLIFATVAQIIGFPLIALAALLPPSNGTTHQFPDGRKIAYFKGLLSVLLMLWENDEDGIDGIPLTATNQVFKNQSWIAATKTWSRWRRIFVWSAWRNSVNNQRYLWPFKLLIDPSKVQIRYFLKNSAYFIWQGPYSALYLTLGTRYIFIGYKFHQTDAAAELLSGMPAGSFVTTLLDSDTRKPGAGFAFDLLAKVDPTSWTTPIKH